MPEPVEPPEDAPSAGFVDQAQLRSAIEEMTGGEGHEEPGEPEGAPEPAQVPGGVAGAPEMIQLPDGSTIALDRLSELAQLDHAFRDNPQIAARIKQTVAGQGLISSPPPPPSPAPPASPAHPAPHLYPLPPSPPAPYGYPPPPPQPPVAPPQLPPEVDPSDPTVQWVLAQQAAQQAAQAQLVSMVQAQQATAAQAQQMQIRAGVERARNDIKAKYPHLTFDDLAAMDAHATSRGLGTAFYNLSGDPYQASYEALQTAAFTMPELQQKLSTTPARVGAQGEAARQQRLNALAGGSGNAPRNPPEPRTMNPAERKEALRDAVAQMLQDRAG